MMPAPDDGLEARAWGVVEAFCRLNRNGFAGKVEGGDRQLATMIATFARLIATETAARVEAETWECAAREIGCGLYSKLVLVGNFRHRAAAARARKGNDDGEG